MPDQCLDHRYNVRAIFNCDSTPTTFRAGNQSTDAVQVRYNSLSAPRHSSAGPVPPSTVEAWSHLVPSLELRQKVAAPSAHNLLPRILAQS